MCPSGETPKERRARQELEEYLSDGEELLAYTSSDIVSVARKPLVGLTPERIIWVSSEQGAPSDGVFDIRRDNIKSVKWSGLWARLKIRGKSPRHIMEFSVRGRIWKKRAQELARLAMQASPNSSSDLAFLSEQSGQKPALNVDELSFSIANPQLYLEKARDLEREGVIGSAHQRFLQRVRDIRELGRVDLAYRSLNKAMHSDASLGEDQPAASLLRQLFTEKLALRVGAGFLFGFVLVAISIIVLRGIFGEVQDAKDLLFKGEGVLVFYDLLFGIGLWKGRSRLRICVILRAIGSFLLFGIGVLSWVGFLNMLAEAAFSSSVVLVLLSKSRRNLWIAIAVYVIGFLGVTLFSILLSLLPLY